jgi:fibronectin-binding autotransporter adhesin
MKRLLSIFFFLVTLCIGSHCQTVSAGDLPAGYLGSVLNYSYGTQLYTYTYTPTVSGVDYVGFAFRQDPGFWTFTNPSVTAGNSSTNLLINGNLQYGGGLSVNTTNYGTQYIQAPSGWGVWYQTGIYPSAAGYWSPGQWYDGAVGSYDGIYQGISVTAGVTYNISFDLSGTNPSSNPSIEVGTYMGACAAGTSIFTCVPTTSASMSAVADPQQTQGVGGAPTVTSTSTTNATSTIIVGNNQVTVTTPTVTTHWSDGTTTTSTGTPTQTTLSSSAFTGVHFGAAQVADTQWNISACTTTSTCQVYSTHPGGTYETGSWLAIGSTQYVTFIPNTGSDSATNPWTMILVNADGTFTSLGTGRVLVQGVDSTGNIYLFFTNANYNGTLLSGNLGLSGQGVTFTGTANPTVAQTNTLASNMSSTPLAAGQTGGTGGGSSPTVVSTQNTTILTTTTSGSTVNTYSQPVIITTWSDGSQTTANNGSATLVSSTVTGGGGGTTSGQQSDITGFNSNPINGAGIYIRQSGSNDVITISQIGTHNLIGGINQQFAVVQDGNNYISIKQGNGNPGKNEIDLSVTGGSNNLYLTQASDPNGVSAGDNYQKVNIAGFSNTVTTSQTNDGGLVGHFAEINVTGNYNTVSVTQGNNTQKQAFVSANGNNNTITTSQTGTGAHYVSVTEVGNGNSATVTQTGSTANTATISLTNSGAPASVNLTQTGGQSYSVNQTCYTTACGTITVRQGN